MIRDLTELLAATGCATVDELAGTVDDTTELTGDLEVGAEDVTLVVDLFWCDTLSYPFTVGHFWEALGALDEESLAAYVWFDETQPVVDDDAPPDRSPVHSAVLARDGADAAATGTG